MVYLCQKICNKENLEFKQLNSDQFIFEINKAPYCGCPVSCLSDSDLGLVSSLCCNIALILTQWPGDSRWPSSCNQ